MTPHESTLMFLAIGVMLAAALAFGELARMVRQPAILGEIFAGIVLGPTLLGRWAPQFTAQLFPSQGNNAIALQGLTTLAVILFLLVAGMELDLSSVWRQGRTALTISVAGIVIPFALGFSAAWFLPQLMGSEPSADRLIFALFIATALSISALPVIAKTLIDLNLYRSDLGMVVIASAIFDDLSGWIIFAIILGMMGRNAGHASVWHTIGLTLGYTLLMLTVGRWLIHRIFPWILAYTSVPAGVMGFCFSLALFSAAFTESIGIHAIFGSFLVGVVVGDTPHLREHIRTIIRQFISFIFAPLFFVSIGLRIDFVSHFNLGLTAVVICIACAGKILGCGISARLSGLDWRESWAVGFGLNARGAMEIILGSLALQYGLISQQLFVALVAMALVTSMMSGPIMARLMRTREPRRLIQFINARTFLNRLKATTRHAVILDLAQAAAKTAGLSSATVAEAVWNREHIMSTGLGKGLAVPHARLEGLSAPIVALGISEEGIDFDAPDGLPAQIIFLILTPLHDSSAQLEILSDIAKTFNSEEMNRRVLQARSFTHLLALLKIDLHPTD